MTLIHDDDGFEESEVQVVGKTDSDLRACDSGDSQRDFLQ